MIIVVWAVGKWTNRFCLQKSTLIISNYFLVQFCRNINNWFRVACLPKDYMQSLAQIFLHQRSVFSSVLGRDSKTRSGLLCFLFKSQNSNVVLLWFWKQEHLAALLTSLSHKPLRTPCSALCSEGCIWSSCPWHLARTFLLAIPLSPVFIYVMAKQRKYWTVQTINTEWYGLKDYKYSISQGRMRIKAAFPSWENA